MKAPFYGVWGSLLRKSYKLVVLPMSDTPKVQMNFNAPVQGAAGNVEGDMVVNAPQQDLAQAAKDIRDLLQQLDLDYAATTTTEQTTALAKKVEQQKPEGRDRIVGALEKGGKKALEKLVDHPAAAIAIAAYEGWKDTKK